MASKPVASLALALTPLLPPGAKLETLLDDATRARLEASWQALTACGFEFRAGADAVIVRHPARNFSMAVQLTTPGDLGELRQLFLALRRTFGRLRDRWMPWLFLPGEAVTQPYEHLRALIGVCQQLRSGRQA